LYGHAAIAHAAGHTRTFPNMTRIGACTDRARRAMAIALAVGLRATAETVAPDHTLKATPLRGASHINHLARLKHIGAEHLADLMIFNIVGVELAQVPYQPASPRQMPLLGLGQALRLDFAEAKLNRLIAITLFVTDLRDNTRANLNHCHGDRFTDLAEHLRHTDFAA
jgi:hypothetical protein